LKAKNAMKNSSPAGNPLTFAGSLNFAPAIDTAQVLRETNAAFQAQLQQQQHMQQQMQQQLQQQLQQQMQQQQQALLNFMAFIAKPEASSTVLLQQLTPAVPAHPSVSAADVAKPQTPLVTTTATATPPEMNDGEAS
jgi:cysteine sulfinate desulfinase/cysteine desulfurase-like protein